MKVCQYCNTPARSDTQKFCSSCGRPFPVAETPAEPKFPKVAPATPSVQESASKTVSEKKAPAPKQPKFKETTAPAEQTANGDSTPARTMNYIVIVLVVLVVVLIGALAFMMLNGRKDNSDSTNPPVAAVSDPVSEDNSVAEANPSAEADEVQAAPVASDTQVVIHNAVAEGSTITVEGKAIPFSIVGTDAVISRDQLSDVCQVRIIAPDSNGGYQTASVWYNKNYGNELSFATDYGDYVSCDATGHGKPGDKFVDVLTWAFYRSFLTSINKEDISQIQYSTSANTIRVGTEVSDYFDLTYDLEDFSANCNPSTIFYNESDGTVVYNVIFRCYYKADGSTTTTTSQVYRTIRLVWEDGIWKVDAFARIDEPTYQAGAYAQLP